MTFQYHNPIQFHFGPDTLEKTPELCKGQKVLLVYGGDSLKKNGVYDRVTGLLRQHDISYVDYGGQTAATWQQILDGRHLLNIIIPTYPSTGSEADSVCDIMEYKGYGVELFGAWPDYCLMDPGTTLSLDRKSTAYSVWVCFIQASAWFVGNHENDIARGFAKVVLQTLLGSYEKLMDDPNDERARANVMWASCVNTMGVFRSGVDQFYPWTLYSVGYIPRVAHHVFGIDDKLNTGDVIEAGCAKLNALLEKSGIPMSLAAHGACPDRKYILGALTKEDFGEFSVEEMYQMVSACYQQK